MIIDRYCKDCTYCGVGLTETNTSCVSLAENMCQSCHTEKENA